MTEPLPLLLSRKPRHLGDREWEDATSWFGGRPKLGQRAWPRSSLGSPMTFLAQVDLGEIARCAGPSVLPREGALAFFIGAGPEESEGGVVHVAEPGAPSDPPADAPAAFNRGGDLFPAESDPAAPRLFPRWPLDITPLPQLAEHPREDDEEDDWHDRRVAAVDTYFARRPYFLSAESAWKEVGSAAPPAWWRTAQLYAEYLEAALRQLPQRLEQHRGFAVHARAALAKLQPPAPRFSLGGFGRRKAEPTPAMKRAEEHVQKCDAQVASLVDRSPAFARFVAETAAWARSAAPWTPMSPDEAARLAAADRRSRTEFDDLSRYYVPSRLDDVATETLRELMVADERAFAAMPEALRDLINARYLLPTGPWHQMFGAGIDIQGNAAAENAGNVLLLQLVYDDMLGWRFGDMGAFQFWIPPGDLATGNWKAARMTFEAH